MPMKTRRWLALLLAIGCFVLLACPVSAMVAPNDDFYVYDGASVLSEETEQYILTHSVELERKTGAQIVVVTVPTLDGRALEEYATDLFRQWGIGDAEKNNGLLLLCSVGDRQFRVEVGYGLEGDLPDGKTGRMQDAYIIPLLKEDKFDEGIKNGYTAFLQEVSAVYDVTITGDVAISYEDEAADEMPLILCVMVSFGLSILGNQFLLKKKKKYSYVAFWSLEGVQLLVMAWILQDFITALCVVGLSVAVGLQFGSEGSSGGRYYGGGFNPVPEADPADGLLDVLIVRKVSRLLVPTVVGKYKAGRYSELPKLVRHIRTKSLKILCDKPTPINLDGEMRLAQEITMEIAREKIRFFYPKGLSWKAKVLTQV